MAEQTDSASSRKCTVCGKPYIKKSFDIPFELGRKDANKQLFVWVTQCACEEKIEAEEKRIAELEELKIRSQIPERFKNEDMKDWIAVPGTEEMAGTARRYVQEIINSQKEGDKKIVESGQGVLLVGAVGTGKTKMICYVGLQLIERLQVRVYYLRFSEFLTTLDEYMRQAAELRSYLDGIVGVQVLIIDDIADCPVTNWKKPHVTALFNERWEKKRTTLMTTMRSDSELCDELGQQVASRMYEMAGTFIVEVESKIDMRLPGNKEKYAPVR